MNKNNTNIFIKSILFIIGILLVYNIIKAEQKSFEKFDGSQDTDDCNTDIPQNTNSPQVTSPSPNTTTNSAGDDEYVDCDDGNDSSGLLNNSSSNDASTIGENIVNLYKELLERQPISSELSSAMTKITQGVLTLEGLRRQLIDTDEYARIIKLQSNELNPELKKMISDQEIISYASAIYSEEIGIQVPTAMELPLRDIYIYLEYNDYAYRAMFRDTNYVSFENDVTTLENLNKPLLISTFLKYYNVNYLVIAGKNIFGSSSVNSTINGSNNSKGATGSGKKCRPKNGLFNKDAAAYKAFGGPNKIVPLGDDVPFSMTQTAVNLKLPLTDITKDEYGKKKIPIHRHDMVLIPEFAWSVPQEFPPVCTTLGQPPLVQPVMNNSKLLLGTPLGDAKNTQIGSIMPKFEYKEYITIPN